MENKYFEKIENIEKTDLKWCGNDNTTSQRNHNGKVSRKNNIVTISLSWKINAEKSFVGFFKLNLENLLKDGYIKIDSDPNYYRLNIYHDYNDNIVIEKMGDNKQIILGKI